MAKRKSLKGKAVKSYVEKFYRTHKHKQPPKYIAGAVACNIREEHGRPCSPRAKRKSFLLKSFRKK